MLQSSDTPSSLRSFPTRRSSDLVESALAEHPAVVEAGVVGAADADDLVKPLAFVVLAAGHVASPRSEEHTSELQSHHDLVCRLLLEKKNLLASVSVVARSLLTVR